MGEKDVVCIYNGILLSHKKEWNNAICSNMDTTRDYHTKWSQKDVSRISLYVEYKIWLKWTYQQERNRLTDIEKRLVVAKGEGVGEGMEWEVGVSRCKQLLLLSHFSRVRLCATPETAAHQAHLSLGFSMQEHWSGLPFPSPMNESGWKWSCSFVSDSQRPHGLQPTRLLHPWDFPGKSTGVGCHCLLRDDNIDRF